LRFGIDDPIAWLEAVRPEVWRLWRAFDKLEPIGKDDGDGGASPIAALRALEARFE
jgi:hypothetical protein